MSQQSTFPYRQLILAAGASDEEVGKLVVEYGFAECAAALVSEVVSRCEPPALDRPVLVLLDLHHEEQRIGHVLTLSADGIASVPGNPDPAGGTHHHRPGLVGAQPVRAGELRRVRDA